VLEEKQLEGSTSHHQLIIITASAHHKTKGPVSEPTGMFLSSAPDIIVLAAKVVGDQAVTECVVMLHKMNTDCRGTAEGGEL